MNNKQLNGYEENIELRNWQISGIMLFVQELYNILDNIRDGLPAKKYTKKDILEVIKLFQKFDKLKWHQFLDKKFIVRVDEDGKPCCRTIKTFRIINDDYLDETNKDGKN